MDSLVLAMDRELERFQSAIGSETDPTMLVLRAHLFSENLLARLLTFNLPRGDKVIDSGNLSYHQKLVIVDALDCVPDAIISSLRNLNKLRNQCAHELNKKITDDDIRRVGSPLGQKFTKLTRDAKFDEVSILHNIIIYVCGFLAGRCHRSEHPDRTLPKSAKKKAARTSRSTRTVRKRAAH